MTLPGAPSSEALLSGRETPLYRAARWQHSDKQKKGSVPPPIICLPLTRRAAGSLTSKECSPFRAGPGHVHRARARSHCPGGQASQTISLTGKTRTWAEL